jgi:hypothetical protein
MAPRVDDENLANQLAPWRQFYRFDKLKLYDKTPGKSGGQLLSGVAKPRYLGYVDKTFAAI